MFLGEDWLVHKRHLAIVDYQLQVGPGSNGFHGSVLAHEDVFITVVLQSCVHVFYEVIAVVDYGIVVTWRVVFVLCTYIELRDFSQVVAGCAGHIAQVAAQLAEKNGAVAQCLQFLQDARHAIYRIGVIVQLVVLCIDYMVGLLIEKVGTTAKTRNDAQGTDEYADFFHDC